MSVASVLKNRNFISLLLANTFLAAAFPIQLVLGVLSGLLLAPNEGLVTLPSSVQTFAGLVAAAPFSILMGRMGRKAGFGFGSLLTAVGALVATVALYHNNFFLLCFGHFLMGAGWASFQYFRFAAAEVVHSAWRPVSISLMLTSGLIAAIIGPQIFIMAKDGLAPIPLAGAYAAIIVLCCVGILPLVLVRIPLPDLASTPFVQGRLVIFSALRNPQVRRAVVTASISQGVMVFLMIPVPIAMISCGFVDTDASDVVRWHIVAMFAPSFFTGFLIKRFGVDKITLCGLAMLAVASGLAAVGISAVNFYSSMIVLGLGWNFSFIGATSMLTDWVPESEKAVVQGANDTVIALVSTICAFAAGAVISSFGWTILNILSAIITIVTLVILALRYRPLERAMVTHVGVKK